MPDIAFHDAWHHVPWPEHAQQPIVSCMQLSRHPTTRMDQWFNKVAQILSDGSLPLSRLGSKVGRPPGVGRTRKMTEILLRDSRFIVTRTDDLAQPVVHLQAIGDPNSVILALCDLLAHAGGESSTSCMSELYRKNPDFKPIVTACKGVKMLCRKHARGQIEFVTNEGCGALRLASNANVEVGSNSIPLQVMEEFARLLGEGQGVTPAKALPRNTTSGGSASASIRTKQSYKQRGPAWRNKKNWYGRAGRAGVRRGDRPPQRSPEFVNRLEKYAIPRGFMSLLDHAESVNSFVLHQATLATLLRRGAPLPPKTQSDKVKLHADDAAEYARLVGDLLYAEEVQVGLQPSRVTCLLIVLCCSR